MVGRGGRRAAGQRSGGQERAAAGDQQSVRLKLGPGSSLSPFFVLTSLTLCAACRVKIRYQNRLEEAIVKASHLPCCESQPRVIGWLYAFLCAPQERSLQEENAHLQQQIKKLRSTWQQLQLRLNAWRPQLSGDMPHLPPAAQLMVCLLLGFSSCWGLP